MANRLGARRGSREEPNTYFCDDLIIEGLGDISWQCTCPSPCECAAAVTGPHWGKPCDQCLLDCENSDVWLLGSQLPQVRYEWGRPNIGNKVLYAVWFVTHLYLYLVLTVFDVVLEALSAIAIVHRLLLRPWNVVILIAALV